MCVSIEDINIQYLLRILRNRYLLFFVGILLIILFSRTWKIDQNIADKSQGYFVHKNIEQANEAGRLGYIKFEVNDYAQVFGTKWTWKPGIHRMRIIRSGPEDFDDIGYISLLQLIAIAGKKITITFVEKLHNSAFIISALILSFIIAIFLKNIFAGWIFLILALILKSKILSLVYGSPDSRTFVIFFPLVVMSIIFGLNWLNTSLGKFWTLMLVLLFGLLIGGMVLIRRSEGMSALLAILFCIVFLRNRIRQKAVTIIFLMTGYFLITMILPITFALHRDIKTGDFNGDMTPYIQTTGKHQAWHSVVLGIGKYPNSIGMKYSDVAVYDILRSKYPDAMDTVYNFHGKGYYKALQSIYFEYIINHPIEYSTNIAKAYTELFYFIPYSVSVGNLTLWQYGYLPKKAGVSADDWDFAFQYPNNLINLKYRYLRLNFMEWGTFIIAVLIIIFAVRASLFNMTDLNSKNIFLPILFYVFLSATQRAIIPQHGFSFMVGFWILSIISLLYISFNNSMIKGFLYWRLKIFSI